jgi:hypothetical protein
MVSKQQAAQHVKVEDKQRNGPELAAQGRLWRRKNTTERSAKVKTTTTITTLQLRLRLRLPVLQLPTTTPISHPSGFLHQHHDYHQHHQHHQHHRDHRDHRDPRQHHGRDDRANCYAHP